MKNKMDKVDTNIKDTCSTPKKNFKNFYDSSDLYLSAFLKSKEVILHNIKRANKKIIFVFQDEGSIPGLVKKYFNDEPVGVLSFKAALTDLRSIIFNYKNP